jgi:hypothetical protein
MAKPAPKLERSSVEAYAAIAIGIALAVIHMTWQWKVAAFAVLAFLFVDLAWRSPWTYQWSKRYKSIGAAISLFIVGCIGYNPIVDQYVEDHRPTAASFNVSLTALRICVWPAPFPPNSIPIVVWGGVENVGARSVAKHWSLFITPPGGKEYQAEPLHYSDGGSICGEIHVPDDALEDKTENHDVEGIVHGKLAFLSTGVSKDYIVQGDSLLRLCAEDKDAKRYCNERYIKDIGSRFISPLTSSPASPAQPTSPAGK